MAPVFLHPSAITLLNIIALEKSTGRKAVFKNARVAQLVPHNQRRTPHTPSAVRRLGVALLNTTPGNTEPTPPTAA